MKEEDKIEFEDGCMWEGGPWKVVRNKECSELGGGVPCKHCHSESIKIHTRTWDNNSTWEEKIWICPYVMVAYNEGGHNSTGVCLDCILEDVKLIKKESNIPDTVKHLLALNKIITLINELNAEDKFELEKILKKKREEG